MDTMNTIDELEKRTSCCSEKIQTMKKIAQATIDGNIFKAKIQLDELDETEDWKSKYFFYYFLFKYCYNQEQLNYVQRLYENNKPNCDNFLLRFIENKFNETQNKLGN